MSINNKDYFECIDDEGKSHKLTASGWAKHMESIGRKKNNSADAISGRYRRRKLRSYSLRQVVGFEPIKPFKRIAQRKADISLVNQSLRVRLFNGQYYLITAGGWSR